MLLLTEEEEEEEEEKEMTQRSVDKVAIMYTLVFDDGAYMEGRALFLLVVRRVFFVARFCSFSFGYFSTFLFYTSPQSFLPPHLCI